MSATASRSRSRSTVSPAPGCSGHVDSLSPASGLEFALLPPDNATGNFTKIVQRVPVKIVLDDQRLAGLLRPGMSAEPTVDTKATVLAERESQARLAADAALTRPERLAKAHARPSIYQDLAGESFHIFAGLSRPTA